MLPARQELGCRPGGGLSERGAWSGVSFLGLRSFRIPMAGDLISGRDGTSGRVHGFQPAECRSWLAGVHVRSSQRRRDWEFLFKKSRWPQCSLREMESVAVAGAGATGASQVQVSRGTGPMAVTYRAMFFFPSSPPLGISIGEEGVCTITLGLPHGGVWLDGRPPLLLLWGGC